MNNEKVTKEILNKLNYLNPVDKGDYYVLSCPKCGEREAYLYKNSFTIGCSRANHCGAQTPVKELISMPKPVNTHRRRRPVKIEETKEIDSELLKTINSYFLRNKKNTKDYLETRGYSRELIEKLSSIVGYCDTEYNLKNYLKERGYSYNAFKDMIFFNNSYTIPFYNKDGTLIGFIYNTPDDANQKYKNSKYLKTSEYLYGFEKYNNEETVILTEGIFDSLVPTVYGIKVYSTIGANLKKHHIDILKNKENIKNIILANDNDEAGRKATKRDKIKLEEEGYTVFILDFPNKYKDIDDYLKKHSIDDLQQLVTISASQYKKNTKKAINMLEDKLNNRTASKIKGFHLNKFSATMNTFKGIQNEYYIISGEQGTGKTAFAVNLSLDILESNPNKDAMILFFSMDVSEEAVYDRFLGIMSGLGSNEMNTVHPMTPQVDRQIEETYKKLIDYINNEQIAIFDTMEAEYIGDIKNIIQTYQNKDIFVVIDHIQRIRMDIYSSDFQMINREISGEIKKMAHNSFKIPIFCTSEITKGDKKSPAWSIAYQHDPGVEINLLKHTDRPSRIDMEIRKNRPGVEEKTIELNFNRETGIMKEVSIKNNGAKYSKNIESDINNNEFNNEYEGI